MPSRIRRSFASSLALLLLVATPAFAVLRDGSRVFPEERACIRVVLFSNTGAAGSYAIDCGRPEWKGEYEQQFDELTIGKRFRFGKDHWSRLDTNCGLSIGGKEVKAGDYYLALERNKKGEYFLVLLAQDDVRKSRLDPFQSAQVKGGQLIPLDHASAETPAPRLDVQLEQEGKNDRVHRLTITFGPHRLTATIQAKA
jgi:hypothetical protein